MAPFQLCCGQIVEDDGHTGMCGIDGLGGCQRSLQEFDRVLIFSLTPVNNTQRGPRDRSLGMTLSKNLLADRGGFSKTRLGVSVAASSGVNVTKIMVCRGRVGMFGPEKSFDGAQCSQLQRLCLGVLPEELKRSSKVSLPNRCGCFIARCLFPYSQRLAVSIGGLSIASNRSVRGPKVVQADRRFRTI